jgi:NAD-dependent dihydropyrimidine dehydrogenase PreA subunit
VEKAARVRHELQRGEEVIMPAKINYKKCIGCKKCYDLCPIDVFTMDETTNMPAATYNEECWHCGICWMECPKRAIDITYPASFW